MNVPLELVKKYNVAGPRYTSYPPATQFKEPADEALLAERFEQTRSAAPDLSLYFHLPFCKSLCWYCGCTTVITSNSAVSGKYLSYIEREIALAQRFLSPKSKVVQVHLGGGTPTFLAPSELSRLGNLLKTEFNLSGQLEASVEIDPRGLTLGHVSALAESGFRRASIGVQDFDPEVQQAVHRIQPRELTFNAVQDLRSAGFNSINIDLIYGLPKQTTQSFAQTLDAVLELNPDRITAFSYAHVPWMKPAQKILENAVLPTPEIKLQLLKLTVEKLTSSGYVYIGMDHFARKADSLALAQERGQLRRNFQGYSTCNGADIWGFGMSSISQGPNYYWQNQKELDCYYQSLDSGRLPLARTYFLSREDEIRRDVIMRLMCDLRLDFTQVASRWKIAFSEHFALELKSLDDLAKDGLIETSANALSITELGRLFIRNIAMRFDPLCRSLLAAAQSQTPRFSRTI
jgi:oxygen-independent coproporphyrinogen-3 oxidase